MLYNTGTIRKAGRVDHKDSFLDSITEERERGITIFSKQALFKLGEKHYTLMDTPGHVDFSAEMERALSVLDYAVLIISAPDGIHGHDITLWKLLKAYKIPIIVFVNKMDQQGADKEKILKALSSKFGHGFVDIKDSFDTETGEIRGESAEDIALLDESVMESFLETGSITSEEVSGLIAERKLFPCCFGSALKNDGVDSLLSMIENYTVQKKYKDSFAGRVFKITRDKNGRRIAHVKITGGVLKPKDMVAVHTSGRSESTSENAVYEKIEQIMLFNGEGFEQLKEAFAGMAVAVTGLDSAAAGTALGDEPSSNDKLLIPLFTSKVTAPFDVDKHKLYLSLKELEEEIPEIELFYDEENKEINIRLMGEVQTEIIKELVKRRFGVDIGFGEASIVYKETVMAPVIGVGHFEPLKHYAEAHILIEPLKSGSGIEIVSDVSEDVLALRFQRLIMSHLEEKKYRGVLMGSELEDVKFTLISGKAHEKHTEGGDFREATYRAVRQGLMKAMKCGACRLLEPYYNFELTVPANFAGRAMTDLSQRADGFEGPLMPEEEVLFKGRAAVSKLRGYAQEVLSYSGGFGRLSLSFGGYGPCANEEEVLSEHFYDAEADISDPTGSVFCSHGAGYYVPWDEADGMMHIDVAAEEIKYGISDGNDNTDPDADPDYFRTGDDGFYAVGSGLEPFEASSKGRNATDKNASGSSKNGGRTAKAYDYLGAGLSGDKELESIWSSVLGKNINKAKALEKRSGSLMRNNRPAAEGKRASGKASDIVDIVKAKEQVLLVDGYNIIFAWEELNELAKLNIDAARGLLADILSNYQGFKGMNLILVFDAYKVKGGKGSVQKYHNIYIVYTKEAQTADAYIEKTVHENAKNMRVTVATNDGMEQTIVFGDGAQRMSARELYEAVKECNKDIERQYLEKTAKLKNRIGDTEK
ncbi:MAG: TetM/TetW/TetO/TetS family tetracycline resistance ribosomal protection protein [Lachnospiraceae bacterium]|nr:TetM/TetW/TetO/TetS family tetracycline resistance ribosomal protection protein [Lachnospiraceae bacterium]